MQLEVQMRATSQSARTWMAVLAILVGLFMIGVAPFLVQSSLESVLGSLLEVVEEEPKFASGINLFSLFFPFWRAVGFVAGITLLVIAYPIYKGQEWTWPVALLAHAVPAIGGMFMFLPHVSWVEGFPIPMVISWVGLAGFWGTLLLRRGDRRQKLVDFLAFSFIGMLATHSFTLGIGSQRMLMTRPGQPLFAGPEMWILTLVGLVDWIATAMLIIAIPLLAMRKEAGWWLALIAGFSVLLVDAPTQLIRTATLDYLWGSLIALGLLIILLIPGSKARLFGQEQGEVTPARTDEVNATGAEERVAA